MLEYFLYVCAVVVRAGSFYYLALILSPAEFVLYNSYVYYSDLFMTVVNSGTVTAFAGRGAAQRQLPVALVFEGSFVLALVALYWVKLQIDPSILGLHTGLLFLLPLLRTLNLVFSRYFLFSQSVSRSNLNDLLGNCSWIGVVAILRWAFGPTALENYFWVWVGCLVLGVAGNVWTCRAWLRVSGLVRELRGFWAIYLKSFHFTLIHRVYGTLEKIIVVHKFGASTDASSYLMASKVTGLAAEMSGGFAVSAASNRIGTRSESGLGEERYLNRLVLLNLTLLLGIGLGIVVCSDWIFYFLKKQITADNMPLLTWLLLSSGCYQIHGIFMVYLQKHGRLQFLFRASIFQAALLGVILVLPLSLTGLVLVQIAGLASLLAADFIVYRKARPQQ